MKVKSAVLASALVAVSSAFANNIITAPWFTKTPTGSGSIDCELNNPVIVNGNAAAVANYYAVTANVSIIIHAARPQPDALILTDGNNTTFNPKGSICAAKDGNTAKWYGLTYENDAYAWTELATEENEAFTEPADNTGYTLVTEFDDLTGNNHRVRYWVGEQCSKWYTSGHADALKKVGLAGTGTYTKIIGLIAYVAQTTGTIPIAIDTSTLKDMGVTAETASDIVTALTTPESNGIAKWANYALGINGTVAANKPFAAPVQNGTANKLTFKLGGVSARTEVADVKYAIETLTSPTANSSGDLTYKSASETTDITLEPSAVKYYRVKVQIDAKSN